jgi:hypothetical protein
MRPDPFMDHGFHRPRGDPVSAWQRAHTTVAAPGTAAALGRLTSLQNVPASTSPELKRGLGTQPQTQDKEASRELCRHLHSSTEF